MINCPRCNSRQNFKRRSEDCSTDDQEMIRIFVKCAMCHFTIIIFEGSKSESKIRADIDKLIAGARRGVPVDRRLADRKNSLVKEIHQNGITTY